MAGDRYRRHLILAFVLTLLSGCNSGSGHNPPPPTVNPPTPPLESPPPATALPPPPPKGIPRDGNPGSNPGPPVMTGSSPSPTPSAVNPVFADIGPSAPLKYRDVGTISLAISYLQSKDQLHAYLISDQNAAENRKAEPKGNTGDIANAPAGKYRFLMARIESCLLMICDTHDDGVRSVDNDPMVWHWAITPERNEGGSTVIIVGIYGSVEQGGPWIKVDAIPDIRESARIESRSWFLDNWDKALSMLGALLAFLFTHWFRPCATKDD